MEDRGAVGRESMDGIPVVAELGASIGIHPELERTLAAKRAQVPDVRGLEVQHRIEVGPAIPRQRGIILEDVFVGIRKIGGSASECRLQNFQGVLLDEVVGVDRDHVLRRARFEASPHRTDDPEVDRDTAHPDSRIAGQPRDDPLDIVRDRSVHQQNPLVERTALPQQAFARQLEEPGRRSLVDAGQQREASHGGDGWVQSTTDDPIGSEHLRAIGKVVRAQLCPPRLLAHRLIGSRRIQPKSR